MITKRSISYRQYKYAYRCLIICVGNTGSSPLFQYRKVKIFRRTTYTNKSRNAPCPCGSGKNIKNVASKL